MVALPRAVEGGVERTLGSTYLTAKTMIMMMQVKTTMTISKRLNKEYGIKIVFGDLIDGQQIK